MTHLLIAGHGQRRNGTFDPGATGIISKGEHKYVKENLFPAMKKYVGNEDVVFFDSYNVYDHGDIVALANKYGKDTIVTEVHYDAGSSAASGGHVIVYSGYEPDQIDLRLRDAIQDMVGVRYTHKGNKGISGRNNLANVNRTQKAGINYRLIELGFGTNKNDADVMLNKTDEYAKKLVEALLDKKTESKPVATPVNKPAAQPIKAKPSAKGPESIVDYLKSKKVDSSFKNRKKIATSHGIKNYTGTADQNEKLLESVKKNGITPKKADAKKYPLPNATYWIKKPLFSGTGVRQVQEALASIYFYPEKGAKNNGVDGYYGAKTADAVKRFQSVNGLKADGEYGPATKKVLNKKVNK